MSKTFEIAFELGAKLTSGFKGALKEAAQSFKDLEKHGKNAVKAGKYMTAGLTVPIMGFGAAAIKTVAGFDDAMSSVKSISGATGKEFDDLRNKAKELGRTTAHSASEAAEGMTILASTGASTNEILGLTGHVLNLASASSLGLEQSAGILTNTMGQFGLEGERAAEVVSNQLVMAANSSKTSVEGMGESLKYAGTAAANMNMDVAQTAAMLGIFANVGIEGSAAGTTFTAMASSLAKKSKDGAIAIGEMSVATYDAQGEMRDMGSIMADVEEATKGMTGEQRNSALQAIFGEQAMKGVNAALSQGAEAYSELELAIRKSDNAAATAAFIKEDNLAGAFRAVSSAVEGFMIDVGDIIKGPVQKIAMGIVSLAGVFGKLSDPMKKVIVIIAGVVAAIGPLLLIVGSLATTALPALSSAFTLIFGPIGLIVGLIIGLGAVLVGLWKTNEDFRNKVIGIWNSIKDAVGNAIEDIKAFWETNGEDIVQRATEIFEVIGEKVSSATDSIVKVVGSMLESIKEFWGEHGEEIVEKAVDIFQSMSEKISNAIEVIKTIFEIVFPVIQGIVMTGLEIITEFWTDHGEGIMETISNAFELIKGVITIAMTIIGVVIAAGIGLIMIMWDMFGENILNTVSIAWNLISGIIEAAMNIVQGIIQAVTSIIQGDWQGAWDGILQIVTGALQFIWTIISTGFEMIKAVITSSINVIKAVISTGFEAIKIVITGVLNAIFAVISMIFQLIIAVITTSVNAMKAAVEIAWNAIKASATSVTNVVKSAWQSVTGVFDTVKNKVVEMGNKIKETWNSVKSLLKNPIKGTVNLIKTGNVDGSHKTGLTRVPYDGYIAELHKGERVLTKSESDRYASLVRDQSELSVINNSEQSKAMTSSKIINMSNYTNNPTEATPETYSHSADVIDIMKHINKNDNVIPKIDLDNKGKTTPEIINPEKVMRNNVNNTTVIHLTNSPQYHIHGGDKEEVQETVENSNDDLLKRIKELQDDDRRLDFG